MPIPPVSIAIAPARGLSFALTLAAFVLPTPLRAATACAFPEQGEGHVTEIIDNRSFRLDDGREIKLAGIESASNAMPGSQRGAALAALIRDRDVSLRGVDDTPDRYGRQTAFAFVAGAETPVQRDLLAQGEALVAADISEKDCVATLGAAEAEARTAKRGIWADAAVIKNAESSDDILAGLGRFAIVEGTVLSVRQAGAVTYLNFGVTGHGASL